MEHLHYDKRLLDHYLKIGKITKKDYDAYINKLEDLEDKADLIDIDEFLAEESQDDQSEE